MAIELLKKLDPKKVEAWDRIHDKRKLYRCERCGAEWKCEYGENKFGKSHEYNGDPDILCQCCDFPTVKEVVLREMENTLEPLCKNCKLFYTTPKCKYTIGPDQYADECHAYKQIDADLKLSDVFPNPFSSETHTEPSDETKYFCCGIDAYMMPFAYATKGSLWFEDEKAGELELINNSTTEYNVIRLVFALETEFNYLSIHKLGDFNFKIEFNKEYDEIQLRLWRKE